MMNKFLFSAAVLVGTLGQVVQAEHNYKRSSPVSAGIAAHFTVKGFTFDTSNALYGVGVTSCLATGTRLGAFAFVEGQLNFAKSDDFIYPDTNGKFILDFLIHANIPALDPTAIGVIQTNPLQPQPVPPVTIDTFIPEQQKIKDVFGSIMIGIGRETFFESDNGSYDKKSWESRSATCAGISLAGKWNISRITSSNNATPVFHSAATVANNTVRAKLRKSNSWSGAVGVLGTVEYLSERSAVSVDLFMAASLCGRDNMILSVSYWKEKGGSVDADPAGDPDASSTIETSKILLKQNIGFTSSVDFVYLYMMSRHAGWGIMAKATWDYRNEEYKTVPSGVTITSYEDALTRHIVGNIGVIFAYTNM